MRFARIVICVKVPVSTLHLLASSLYLLHHCKKHPLECYRRKGHSIFSRTQLLPLAARTPHLLHPPSPSSTRRRPCLCPPPRPRPRRRTPPRRGALGFVGAGALAKSSTPAVAAFFPSSPPCRSSAMAILAGDAATPPPLPGQAASTAARAP